MTDFLFNHRRQEIVYENDFEIQSWTRLSKYNRQTTGCLTSFSLFMSQFSAESYHHDTIMINFRALKSRSF